MNNYLWLAATATAYILGIGTGILLVKETMEREYRKREEDSVESVKEAFQRRKKSEKVKHEQEMEDARRRYETLLKEHGYKTDTESDVENPDSPVYISPDEFDKIEESTDYAVKTVVYHDYDSVFELPGENRPLNDEEWKSWLGADVVREFGKFDDDRVIVRNDANRTYYEVLFDEGEYIP